MASRKVGSRRPVARRTPCRDDHGGRGANVGSNGSARDDPCWVGPLMSSRWRPPSNFSPYPSFEGGIMPDPLEQDEEASLRRLLLRVPALSGRELTVERLGGGMTNRNY